MKCIKDLVDSKIFRLPLCRGILLPVFCTQIKDKLESKEEVSEAAPSWSSSELYIRIKHDCDCVTCSLFFFFICVVCGFVFSPQPVKCPQKRVLPALSMFPLSCFILNLATRFSSCLSVDCGVCVRVCVWCLVIDCLC